MLASNDWKEALGEYKAPTPCGRIGDGGALYMKWKITKLIYAILYVGITQLLMVSGVQLKLENKKNARMCAYKRQALSRYNMQSKQMILSVENVKNKRKI